MLAVSFLTAVTVACSLGVSAAPTIAESNPAKLAVTARFVNATHTRLIDADRARATHFKSTSPGRKSQANKRAVHSFAISNGGVHYEANVQIGNPPTDYTLIVDSGSSNTWVGAGRPYVETSTSQETGKGVSVTYGSGSFSGSEYIDTVTLSRELVIADQSIGVATQSNGFSGVDGILGIGPTALTVGTVSGTGEIPTIVDNLFRQGSIEADVLGVYFQPTEDSLLAQGELTFGGADDSKYTGELDYVPLTRTSPASEYWGIDQSITYSDSDIMPDTAGIVDTGTTLILLASDAWRRYKDATGAVEDSDTGLLRLPVDKFTSLEPLVFSIGKKTYTLPPSGQVWPPLRNSEIGGQEGFVYLVVGDLGNNSGEGLDFILGFAWLQRFYSVLDTANQQIGLATTMYTNFAISL